MEKADAEIDFAQFDSDGPDGVPNSGDDDGKVDTVVIIHSGLGGECYQFSPNIRSRSSRYSEDGYGHDKPFVTRAIPRDAKGAAILGPDGQPEHIVIDDFVIQPAVNCNSDEQAKAIVQIGVFCHEYGHALHLPDLYDRTPWGDEDSQGVGSWCLMGDGAYGGGDHHHDTPVEMSAWCKQYLGWANIKKISSAGELPLQPVEDRNEVYRIDVDASGTEYFLIEYRDPQWRDLTNAHINWDEYLPVAGLAIWHVDENVGATLDSGERNLNWPLCELEHGQNDDATRPTPDYKIFKQSIRWSPSSRPTAS